MSMAEPQGTAQKTTPCACSLLLPKPSHVQVQGYVQWEHEVGQRWVPSLKA